jgi:flagellar basal body rod protein FlgC
MDFIKSIAIAATGMRAQAGRMRIISENIANVDSTAIKTLPGATNTLRVKTNGNTATFFINGTKVR